MSWSPQQEAAIEAVRAWLADPSGAQVFRLFGYAGTGKTTLARELAAEVRGRVLFGSFTGKAALVMRKKGCWNASTLHSMLYKIEDPEAEEPVFVIDPENGVDTAALVVVDEVSMVDEELGADLLRCARRVLVLGDPAQLPPVRGGGYFTNAPPDVMLTEVHRQAADNPIIDLATRVRCRQGITYGVYGETRIIRHEQLTAEDARRADQILVGRNRTRHAYNTRLRELDGRPHGRPVVGDKLICLKNDRDFGIYNGGLHRVDLVEQERARSYDLTLSSEDTPKSLPISIRVRKEFLVGTEESLSWKERRGFQEFTFGYAITVHKSQGSQWDSVLLIDESEAFREHARRWLYTGLTRAAERITVVM